MSEAGCLKQSGYVIFDSICLFLSAAEVRASLTAEVAEEIAEAAKPVLSKLDQYIITIASKESSTTEIGTAVFGIITTIWSGGCLGEVMAKWLGTLDLGQEILYSVTAIATITAACATDGLAEIGLIAVMLANCGWLVDDAVKCVEECAYA
jgi:hypothetical protein